MTSRERIKKIFNFQIPDRVGIYDYYWNETLERWRHEGLPEDILYEEYFNHDVWYTMEFWESDFDQSLRIPEKIVEETEDTLTRVNEFGMTERVLKGVSGAAQILDVKVKNRRDWEECKSLLVPSEDRIRIDLKRYTKATEKGKFRLLAIRDSWLIAWRLHGMERFLINIVLDPTFIKDMIDYITNFNIQMISIILDSGFEYDGIEIMSDYATKQGLMFSPALYEKLIFPAHIKLYQFLRRCNLPIIFDSDGDNSELIPFLIKGGITALFPLEERIVGNNILKLKSKYRGKLVLIGNIEVTSDQPRDVTEERIRNKLKILKKGGGYIYHSDHSVPPSVSLEYYEYLLGLVRKYGTYVSLK